MNKIVLKEGQSVFIKGSTDIYEIKKTGNVISCTCKSWLNMKKPVEERVCKHMKDILESEVSLQEQFEKVYEETNVEFQAILDQMEAIRSDAGSSLTSLRRKLEVLSEKTGIPIYDNAYWSDMAENYGVATYIPSTFKKKFNNVDIDSIIDGNSDLGWAINSYRDIDGGEWVGSSC